MSRDTRMRNDDLALCLWAHDVWGGISRKPLEIETWVQRTTNRKFAPGNRMVTWPMTSRDPERSRSWHQYVWCPLSRKWLDIATSWQCSAYRKWAWLIEHGFTSAPTQYRLYGRRYRKCPGNWMVTWPMTSRDSERSRSWHRYVWCILSRKWIEIATGW